MKRAFLIVGLALISTTAGASMSPSYVRQHYPMDIQPLLLLEGRLDDQCRAPGVDSDGPACTKRDAIVAKLERRGWCWGSRKPYALAAGMRWLPCRLDRNR